MNLSLLWVVLFWLPVVQGSVALVAATELCNAEWLKPVRKPLLSLYPLQILFIGAFLLLGRDLSLYPTGDGLWFTPGFWVGRMVALLFFGAVTGHFLSRAVISGSPSKSFWATLYLLGFAGTQGLLGVDWVMALEYPWISTLFPFLFILEAFLCGLAVAAIVAAFLNMVDGGRHQKTLFDAASFLLGLSLFATGMWFAHHLTIWFANIPEEVDVLLVRVNHPTTAGLLLLGAILGSVIPVLMLTSRMARTRPGVVVFAAFSYLGAIPATRLGFLLPTASFSVGLALGQWLLAAVAVNWVLGRAVKAELN